MAKTITSGYDFVNEFWPKQSKIGKPQHGILASLMHGKVLWLVGVVFGHFCRRKKIFNTPEGFIFPLGRYFLNSWRKSRFHHGVFCIALKPNYTRKNKTWSLLFYPFGLLQVERTFRGCFFRTWLIKTATTSTENTIAAHQTWFTSVTWLIVQFYLLARERALE